MDLLEDAVEALSARILLAVLVANVNLDFQEMPSNSVSVSWMKYNLQLLSSNI